MFKNMNHVGIRSFFSRSEPDATKSTTRPLTAKQCRAAKLVFGPEHVGPLCKQLLAQPEIKQVSDDIAKLLNDLQNALNSLGERVSELEKQSEIDKENDKNFQGTNWLAMQSRSKVYPSTQIKSNPNTHEPYSKYVDVTVKEFFDKK